jgi:hypothetical protein
MWFRKKIVTSWHDGVVAVARQVFATEDLKFEQALFSVKTQNSCRSTPASHVGFLPSNRRVQPMVG